MSPVNQLATAAAKGTIGPDVRPLQNQVLMDAVLGLLTLLVITALSVFKPWGITPRSAEAGLRSRTHAPGSNGHARVSPTWGMYALLAMGGLVAFAIIIHLLGGGLHPH